jgi:ketosteroid isomerase-like protein
MSQENVDMVRESFERFNREGYLPEELFDPAIELSNVRESPLPGPYRGYEGLRQWRDDLCEVLNEARFEIEEQIDVEAKSAVITRLRLCGRARHTDIAIDYPFTIVGWVRNGRTYRSEGYTDHSEALEAAGLSE